MKKSFVYILLSHKDKKTYVGSTIDLDNRIIEHSKGLVLSTKNRRPLELIYEEGFNTIEEARAKEKFYKTSYGRRKLRKIIDPIIKQRLQV